MSFSRQRPWHHNTEQYTLLEFASLQRLCPEGVYLSLRPGKPAQWSGVIFVRKGPYAPATLRFQITFPPDYPTLPPSIIFTSDIFHPLVAPLTTYTYSTGSSSLETVSATDEERLTPGGFSLRHGFPQWYRRAHASAGSSANSSRDASGSYEQKLRDAIRVPPQDTSSRASSVRERYSTNQDRYPRILEVLEYMKHAFDDQSALDALPLDAAGNSGAWKAWRAYRKTTDSGSNQAASETGTKQQDDWSWDGVWEERVRKGIDASISESTLYGNSASSGESLIRFVDIDDDLFGEIRAKMQDSVEALS